MLCQSCFTGAGRGVEVACTNWVGAEGTPVNSFFPQRGRVEEVRLLYFHIVRLQCLAVLFKVQQSKIGVW